MPNHTAEAFRKNGLPKGAVAPKAADIDLATFDITDPEFWRHEIFWDYFAKMRKEAPVIFCPDSPYGPYWSVTTYKDIMTVDTSHGIFSSEGGITVVDQDADFQLPMFIAMDPPKHDLQRKTVQSIVGPENSNPSKRGSARAPRSCLIPCRSANHSTGSTRCRSNSPP